MTQPGSFDAIPIPRRFLREVLPAIRDTAELKVTLTVFALAANGGDWPGSPVLEADLFNDSRLHAGLRDRGSARAPLEAIKRGVELAVARGTLLRFSVRSDRDTEVWLLPDSPESRRLLARLESGEQLPPAVTTMSGDSRVEIERPNIFQLYEQNIGLITPIIADQMIEALEIYPESWIESAIAEAVSYNRRHWRYIQRILARWETEGRGDEADQRSSSAPGSLDPDKYLRGKYAPLFRRRE